VNVPERWLVRLDVIGTVVFVLVTVASAVSDADAVTFVNLAVCTTLFVIGSAVWTWGFLSAAGRSRTHVIDLAGLFYLTGSAPTPVRRTFLGLWFAQIAVAVASIAVTSPPFGVMVPVFGIGLLTRWAAANGTFPERTGGTDPRSRRSAPE
jgi:hypothetical protein